MKKAFNLLVLIALLFMAQHSIGQQCNMLTNTDFKYGFKFWEKINHQGGWAVFTTSGDTVTVDVKSKAAKIWGIQLTQGKMLFETNKTYRVTIEARADADKKLGTGFSKNGDPWTGYFSKELDISTEWQTYTYEFTFTHPTEKNGRIELNVGLDTADIYFRNIKVEATNCLNGSESLILDDATIAEREAFLAEASTGGGVFGQPRTINKEGFTPISVRGYVRLSAMYRNLSELYIAESLAPKAIIVNGVEKDTPLSDGYPTGYREPLMQLELAGKPTSNTEFGVDMLFDNQLIGMLSSESRRLQIMRWINLKGSILTDYGKFTINFGGINYLNMSPLTMWRYEIRDDMFERTPWEWSYNSFGRYEEYYNKNAIAKDARFGNVAFQGINLKAEGLPKRFGVDLMYGKSDGSNNGFQSFLSNNYKFISANRIYKRVSKHTIGFNSYNQIGFRQNTALSGDTTNEEREHIHSIDAHLNFKKVKSHAEFGLATFTHPAQVSNTWDPVFNIKTSIAGIASTGINVSTHLFYIGRNFINPNSIANNASIFGSALEPTINSIYLSNNFFGGINEIGQVTNNRKGLSLVFSKDFKKLKASLGFNASQDVSFDPNNGFDRFITFQHYNAGINRSRFVYYRSFTGPLNRNLNVWRRSFESLYIADTTVTGPKNYNTMDMSLRYKTRIGGKGLVFTNYTNYNSVSQDFSPMPRFNTTAYVRTFYNEFMTFFQLKTKTTIVLLYSFEFVKGNAQVNTADENGLAYQEVKTTDIGNGWTADLTIASYRPEGATVNQFGKSLGVGLDLDITETSGLYLRQKWYSHKDPNFALDQFKGWEFSAEFKIRF